MNQIYTRTYQMNAYIDDKSVFQLARIHIADFEVFVNKGHLIERDS